MPGSLIAYGLLALAILGALGGFVYKERQAGYDKAEALYKPKLTACQNLNTTLGAQIKEQNAAVEKLAADGAAKQRESAKALSKAEERAKTWDADATRLRNALTARKPDGPRDCKAAWEAIRKPQ